MSTRQRAQRGETTEFSGRVRRWERVQRYQKTNPLNSEGVMDYGWVEDANGNHERSSAHGTSIKKEMGVPSRNLQHISCLATWSQKKEKEHATATENNERKAGGANDLEHDLKQKKLKLKING
eukprot:jgi/Picsp_1/5819/NSC_03178-R1_---NA---